MHLDEVVLKGPRGAHHVGAHLKRKGQRRKITLYNTNKNTILPLEGLKRINKG